MIRIGFSIAIEHHLVLNAIGGMDMRRKLDLERMEGGAARIRLWFEPSFKRLRSVLIASDHRRAQSFSYVTP
jgi:hypothetical protein